jgi:uncharacterized membrane protein
MQLLFLLLLLIGPYLVVTLLGRWFEAFLFAPQTSARIGVTLFFLFTALGHFIRTKQMAEMVPPAIPYRVNVIYLTGILELLGVVGIWIPQLTRLIGFCLILMLVCLLPANIYSALHRVDFGGHGSGPVYLLIRIPFQLLVILWTYFATNQNWFGRHLAG